MPELLPLLFALACPLGMLAMMAGPALARRFARRTQPSTTTPQHSPTATDNQGTTDLATARR